MSQDSNNNAAKMSCWTLLEEMAFERAFLMFPEDMPDRWERIANYIPGKSSAEVRVHYETLLQCVNVIELPSYPNDSAAAVAVERVADGGLPVCVSPVRRRKGTPWTEEEHKRFLIGLRKYGKGDWRRIARYAIVTRTPTQVASHAQKYFLRQTASNKMRKRASIHDITIGDSDLIPDLIDQNSFPPTNVPVEQQFDQNWVRPPDVPMQQQQFDQNWVRPPDVPMQQQQFDQNWVRPTDVPMLQQQLDQNLVLPTDVSMLQQQLDENWLLPTDDPMLQQQLDQNLVLPTDVPMLQQQLDQNWLLPTDDPMLQQLLDQNLVLPADVPMLQQQLDQNWLLRPGVPMQQQSQEMQQFNQNWVLPPDVPMQQESQEMQQFNQNWVLPPYVPMQQQRSQEMQQLNPPNNLPDQMGGFVHFEPYFQM